MWVKVGCGLVDENEDDLDLLLLLGDFSYY